MTHKDSSLPKTFKRRVLIAFAVIILLSITSCVTFLGFFAASNTFQHRVITAIASFKGYDIALDEDSHIKIWGVLDIKITGLRATPVASSPQKPTITLESLSFKAPLLDFWESYHFIDFSLQNLKATQPNGDVISIAKGGIESDFLSINGQNNKKPFSLKLSLRNNMAEGSQTPLYSLADKGHFDLSYQDIKAKASYELASSNKGITLNNISMGRTVLSGMISVDNLLNPDLVTLTNLSTPDLAQLLYSAGVTTTAEANNASPMPISLNGYINMSNGAGIKGNFKSLSFGNSKGSLNFKTAPKTTNFDLVMDKLSLEDAKALSGLNIKPSTANEKKAASALSGSLNIKSGTYADQEILSGLFTYKDDTKTQSLIAENAKLAQSDEWILEALNSEKDGFAFQTNLRNAALKDLLTLSGNASDTIKTGRTDVDITLSAPTKITEWAPFPAIIIGKASIALSDSDIDTKLIDRFVGGLINSLFPEAGDVNTTSLNCAFFPVNINKGIAIMEQGLIDTKQAQLMIKGDIDLMNETLDLLITPKPKGLALGDLSVPAHLTGPMSNPSLKPSTFGLGKKIGGLALGIANPVFFAVALSNFSLPKDHPCKAIIEAQPSEKTPKTAETPTE